MSTPVEMETVMSADLVTADGRCWDYEVWLSWSACEPWAVTMTLPSTGEPVEWLFALALLWAGLHSPVGFGDVRFTPRREVNEVGVRFGADRMRCAHVYLYRDQLWAFVNEINAHYLPACQAARAEMDDELAWLIDDPDGLWTAPGGEEER